MWGRWSRSWGRPRRALRRCALLRCLGGDQWPTGWDGAVGGGDGSMLCFALLVSDRHSPLPPQVLVKVHPEGRYVVDLDKVRLVAWRLSIVNVVVSPEGSAACCLPLLRAAPAPLSSSLSADPQSCLPAFATLAFFFLFAA